MIYVREYWTRVDHEGEPVDRLYPVVPGTYDLKNPRVDKYRWENLDAFLEGLGSKKDYCGKLFGGLVIQLSKYYRIFSFQLFKNEDEFPETIEAPWLEEHCAEVAEAWRKYDVALMRRWASGCEENVEEAIKLSRAWCDLTAKTQKELEEDWQRRLEAKESWKEREKS